MCGTFEEYQSLIETMVEAFDEEKEKKLEVFGFKVRFERQYEQAYTKLGLVAAQHPMNQDTMWRYVVSIEEELEFSIFQKMGHIFNLPLEEGEITVRLCIAPPEKA
eukprot:augustus_masked-scaffold_1-processed-gene-32.63-mRNA-1 protein AED:1.00 eAED:1.00 QI:0/-1/0/0/-1/1/1/0/105